MIRKNRINFFKKISNLNIIGPFKDPSSNETDESKIWEFIYLIHEDCFEVSKTPVGHKGIGKRYCNGSKAYEILMKYRSDWDEGFISETEQYSINETNINTQQIQSLPEKTYQEPTQETFNEWPEEAPGFNLIFGDSQIQGQIGKALEQRFGGIRRYKAGSGPSSWKEGGSNFEKIKDDLLNSPNNIYIALGGNSPSGSLELVNTLKKYSPNSIIYWITPPPPAYNGSIYPHNKFVEIRKRYTDFIISQIGNFVNIINSYDIVGNGYNCSSCDGIHATKSVANTIVNSIN